MEVQRILFMSVVFLETSSTVTSSTLGVQPQPQQQQQQRRLLSFGEDGEATPGIFKIGGHHVHLQQPQRSTIGLEQQRNQSRTIARENIKQQIILYLNRSESELKTPLPWFFSDGQRPDMGRKRNATGNKVLRRENKHRIISYGEKGLLYQIVHQTDI